MEMRLSPLDNLATVTAEVLENKARMTKSVRICQAKWKGRPLYKVLL